MSARIVFVSADLQKGLGDWVMSLPAAKLVRDKWGSYADLICICPEPVLGLANLTETFNRVYPYTLDWCERYGDELHGALCLVAMMDSDLFVHDDVARRLQRYEIRNPILRNRHWRTQQHHALMVARNLDCLLGYDAKEPLAHPLTRWTKPRGRYVALHAGRGPLWKREAKDWPYFYNLSRHLLGADWDVIQVVGPSDTTVLEGVPVWQGTLPALADMLLGCQMFVGNDSGVGHLAGALGLPTHIIFGFTDPELWRPVGPRVTWSRAPSKRPEDVTVTEVWAAIQGKLAAYREAA